MASAIHALLEEVAGLTALIESKPHVPFAHLAPRYAALAKQALETELVRLDTGPQDVMQDVIMQDVMQDVMQNVLLLRAIVEPDTTFEKAVASGNIALVQLILESGIPVDCKSFRSACARGFTDIVRLMIKKDFPDYVAFEYACKHGHTEIVHLLLRNGVKEENSIRIALRFAYENNHADLVRYLIEYEMNIHSHHNALYHTLMWASRSGHTDIVRRILDLCRNERDPGTIDAMHAACEKGQIEIVRMLLVESQQFHQVRHVHISVIHRANEMYLSSACTRGHTEIVRLLLPLQRFKLEESENNALQIACKHGHADTVRLLLDNPFTTRMNPADENNKALELACEHGHTEIVRLLLDLPPERGINPETLHNRAHRIIGSAEVFAILKAKFPRLMTR